MSDLPIIEFSHIFSATGMKKSVDVRAPVEFESGAVPGAMNLPILDNTQRAEVGTVYKNQSQDAAVVLGHQLVSGSDKELKIQNWKSFYKDNPQAFIYCFRGGLRSQTAQKWLHEEGIQIPRLQGGYKNIRTQMLQFIPLLVQKTDALVISGATGAGKTKLLRSRELATKVVDLEKIANHRGSAFGGYTNPQPSQAQFENDLVSEWLRLGLNQKAYGFDKDLVAAVQVLGQRSFKLLFEDESRLIGLNALPNEIFNLLRGSPIVWIEDSLEVRVENTYEDYILNSDLGLYFDCEVKDLGAVEKCTKVFEKYYSSLIKISKKLGSLQTALIMKKMIQSEKDFFEKKRLDSNKEWIRDLLLHYYDPMYLGSLDQRSPKVLFKGTWQEVKTYLTR